MSLCVLNSYKGSWSNLFIPKGRPCLKKDKSKEITAVHKRCRATRGNKYKCVVNCVACLPITLLSLIRIMSRGALYLVSQACQVD